MGERFSSISLEAITFLGFVSSLSCKDSEGGGGAGVRKRGKSMEKLAIK